MRRTTVVAVTAAIAVVGTVGVGRSASEVTNGATQLRTSALPAFDPARFDGSATVDNRWLPFEPGMQFVFTGHSKDGRKRLIFTVTDLVKTVAGVRNVVIWDRDYTEGELVEAELAFFAQDNDGNVWHTGEYPEEYEGGKVVNSPAWIAGVKGAKAGIEMQAEPRAGSPSYAQGYAPPPVNWTDRAQVFKMGQATCVPFSCFGDVLITREYNADEPGRFQLKYYVPGVGNVRVGWMGASDTDREVLVLTKLVQLGPEALANVRAEALKLERRAYRTKRNVYGGTPPAESAQG